MHFRPLARSTFGCQAEVEEERFTHNLKEFQRVKFPLPCLIKTRGIFTVIVPQSACLKICNLPSASDAFI